MSDTTASIVANYGHGTRTVGAFHKYGRPRPTVDLFCGIYEVPAGQATIQLTIEGAALTNATAAESDAAATTQALNALATAALTPGSYVSAISPTTQALNRVDPNIVDLPRLTEDEIVYPHERTVAYDASIGIVPVRFAGLSVRVGTAGNTLTPSTIMDAYNTLCTQLLCTPDAVCWLNLKQWTDLVKYGFTTAGTVYASQVGANQLFTALLEGLGVQSTGYMISWGRIHIFVDPDPAQFAVVSSNYIGAMFVPAIPGLNGWPMARDAASRFRSMQQEMPGGLPLTPAFAVGYRRDPAAGPRRALPAGMYREVVTPAGVVIAVTPRLYAGQNLYAVDAWSDVTTVEVNDLAGVGVRSVQ